MSEAMTMNPKTLPEQPTHIGGLLLFYIIAQVLNLLFFIGGIATTGTTVYVSDPELAAGLTRVQEVVLPLNAIASAFLAATLILVMLRKRSAIRATVIILSANIGVAVAYCILSARVMLTVNAEHGITPALAGLAFSIAYNGLWIRYFMRSERVRHTLIRSYGSS